MRYCLKKRKHERGQAISELLAGLIGLCCVMTGVLAFSMLGMAGIRHAIAAREQADEYSMNGVPAGNAGCIADWEYWEGEDGRSLDGLPFTNDDWAKPSGSLANPETFTGQLNTGKLTIADLAKNPGFQSGDEWTRINSTRIFLAAAALAVAERLDDDPLARYEYFDVKRLLKAFGMPDRLSLIDRIAMPVNPMN